VKCDCDLSAQMQSISETLNQQEENTEAMRAFFSRMGFRTWLRELNAENTADKNASVSSATESPINSDGEQQAALFAVRLRRPSTQDQGRQPAGRGRPLRAG
jgi:DNA polymerase-1